MTTLTTIAPTLLLGLQTGWLACLRYYRRERTQFERERELLKAEIKHERRERRRLEGGVNS